MEQELIEDLVIESIRIHGVDVWYINRKIGAKDELLNEDDIPVYEDAYMLEMYIKNVEGFEGDGDFLSKFGLEIRDSMTLSVAIRTFNQEVGVHTEQNRPFEGDLIYFPLNNKIFKIMHVEHEAIFYQMGQLQMYDLRVELFEYSNERFDTGQDFIDNHFEDYRFSVNTGELDDVFYELTVSNGAYFIDGERAPYLEMKTGVNYIFDVSDPTNSIGIIQFYTERSANTEFEITDNSTLVGTPGTANSTLTFTPTPDLPGEIYYFSQSIVGGTIQVSNNAISDVEYYDPFADNITIETEADGILDFSEINPFGESNF
jgi:hypothetical protein